MFQEPRLFRHLNVRRNLEYGRRRAKANDGAGFDQVIALLGLERLLHRMPDALSGGEAQRVAIARALLRSPRFVLMDEPLAALDQARKDEILPFLDRLHAEMSVPIIYVSHNIEEICRLCDYLIVVDSGRVVADGELQSVLVRMDLPILSGEEAGSVISGVVADYDADYDLSSLKFSGGNLWVPGKHGIQSSALRLRIRASDISICRERPAQTTVLNIVSAVVEELQEDRGPSLLVRLKLGSDHLIARITRRSRDELNLQIGDSVLAQIKAVAVRSNPGR